MSQMAAVAGYPDPNVPMGMVEGLPVGISFYTFQELSYTLEVYKGTLKARSDFLDFATFVCFFPQLVAGPIERASFLLGQFQKPRHVSQDGKHARAQCVSRRSENSIVITKPQWHYFDNDWWQVDD